MKGKSLLFLLLGLLLWAQPASAAFAVVSGRCDGTTTGNQFTTSAIDSTGADLIVVAQTCYTGACGTTPTITDSKSNTWTAKTAETSHGNPVTRLYYAWYNGGALSVGSGHTFTSHNASSTFPSLCVIAFSGSLTSSDPFESEGTKAGCTSCSTVTQGSISQTAADLFVVALGNNADGGSAATINSSFTVQVSLLKGGLDYGMAMAYKVSSASEGPQWTNGASTNLGTVGASFKPGGGGGGTTPPYSQGMTILGVGMAVLIGLWGVTGWAMKDHLQRDRAQKIAATQYLLKELDRLKTME